MPAQNPELTPPSTPTKPEFEENQAGEGREEQEGQRSCHNLNETEAIAPKKRAQETR